MPQEALLPCLHSSHQLLPGSNTVSVYLTCLECRHHAKRTRQTGPPSQEFPELQRMLQAWWAKIATTARMMCVYVLMVGVVSFVDHAVHVFPVVDALSTNSPCVDFFSIGSTAKPKSSETACSENMFDESYGPGTAWWVCDESGGSVHNCKKPWM